MTSGSVHPMRGGSCVNAAVSCRAAYRNFGDLHGAGLAGKGPAIGVRLMRTAD